VSEITDRIREYIPATYEALARASYFGQAGFERVAGTIKYRLFATTVMPDMEPTVYDTFSLDFAAKVATLRIIPAAADYWSDQLTGEVAREETINYPDRISSLWRIHERLLVEIKQDQAYFEQIHSTALRRAAVYPRVNTIDALLTPDPQEFGGGSTKKQFGSNSNPSFNLPWSNYG
jgi:hypothetical protein